jgi:hypothetical protein
MVFGRGILPLILAIAAVAALAPGAATAARSINSPAPLKGAVDPAQAMKVQLGWADVSGETGYLIERKAAGGSFAEVAKVGTDVKSFSDVTLVSQTYEYRVRAYKVRGGKMLYSSYTNSVAVATGTATEPTQGGETGTTDPGTTEPGTTEPGTGGMDPC